MTADQIASSAAVSNAHAQSSVDPTFLSTNRELLLAMAREELDKRILQVGFPIAVTDTYFLSF